MISAVKENLYQLSVIRAIILGCEILALVFFGKFRDIGLPVSTLGIILLLHGVVIAATWHRSLKTMEITELEFFSQVLIDVFFLLSCCILVAERQTPLFLITWFLSALLLGHYRFATRASPHCYVWWRTAPS